LGISTSTNNIDLVFWGGSHPEIAPTSWIVSFPLPTAVLPLVLPSPQKKGKHEPSNKKIAQTILLFFVEIGIPYKGSSPLCTRPKEWSEIIILIHTIHVWMAYLPI